jgi:hypothetical protein
MLDAPPKEDLSGSLIVRFSDFDQDWMIEPHASSQRCPCLVSLGHQSNVTTRQYSEAYLEYNTVLSANIDNRLTPHERMKVDLIQNRFLKTPLLELFDMLHAEVGYSDRFDPSLLLGFDTCFPACNDKMNIRSGLT